MTYNDIVTLNSELYENKLYYKLSYVNETTASIWSLGACACDGKEEKFHAYVEAFFAKRNETVTWSENGWTFSVK